jgi:hypothetical protein
VRSYLPFGAQAFAARRRSGANRRAAPNKYHKISMMRDASNFTHFSDGKIYLPPIGATINKCA